MDIFDFGKELIAALLGPVLRKISSLAHTCRFLTPGQFVSEIPREARESWNPLIALLLRELLALDDQRVRVLILAGLCCV